MPLTTSNRENKGNQYGMYPFPKNYRDSRDRDNRTIDVEMGPPGMGAGRHTADIHRKKMHSITDYGSQN